MRRDARPAEADAASATRDTAAFRAPLKALLRGLDRRMRGSQGLIEFDSSPDCMVRVSVFPAAERIVLSDGVVVERGAPVLDIHFWNERLPQTSPGIGFGGRFGRRLARSFGELSIAIQTDPKISHAVAVRGRLAFASERNQDEMARFGALFGFESVKPSRISLALRLHDIAEDVWLFLLTWTYNPNSLKGRSFWRRRENLWVSKERLIEHYRRRRAARPSDAASG